MDARADIYSLGVTLWYALTGKAPFGGKTLDELRHHSVRTALPVEQLSARKVPPAFVTLLGANNTVLLFDGSGHLRQYEHFLF